MKGKIFYERMPPGDNCPYQVDAFPSSLLQKQVCVVFTEIEVTVLFCRLLFFT